MVKYDFENMTVVITGAARGIGFAIAEAFAGQGAHPVIIDINKQVVDEAMQKLQDKGYSVSGYVGDVTNSSQMDEVFSAIIEERGKIDCLINNAGITRDNLLLRMREEEWRMVLEINLTGTFICTQKVFKYMMKARSGSIINIASVIRIMENAVPANYAAFNG